MTVELGEALTSTYSIVGGTARLFERGLVVNGPGGEVVISFDFPMLGRPSISLTASADTLSFAPGVTNTGGSTLPFGPGAINFSLGQWQLEQLAPMIQNALAGRLGLLPNGQRVNAVPLTIGQVDVITSEQRLGLEGITPAPTHGVSVAVANLQERQLYDIAILADGGQWRRVAPHAVYHRTGWTDFGIAHITDMHVARRIDRFRELLVQAGRAEAAQGLYNWNDRFRGFVRYANYLHGIGVLDVIVATGDLYDYMFEDDDDPNGGGNAAFLQRLILGEAPGPDFPDVEELHVPIFMVPGNHDYRKHPYKLIFDAQIRLLNLGALGAIDKDVLRFKNFSGFNLLQNDALVLTNRLDGRSGSEVPNLNPERAGRMLEVDTEIKPYKAFLADRGSYIVRLGAHRIAMLDSAHDIGTVTEVLQALLVKLGLGSEDEATFVGGSPNCEGVSPEELKMVADALEEMPDGALFLVGLHAPLFNMWNSEYPYFLRETQRPTQGRQIHAYLARQDGKPVVLGSAPMEKQVAARHPSWFAGERDNRAPTFVKRVDSQDLMAFGVSRGHAEDLMRLLAGIGARRPADVVLAGHTHRHNEFSVKKMHTGELAYHMDFYTQNPAHYYPTRFTQSWRVRTSFELGTPPTIVPVTDVTYVDVVPGAAPDASPSPMPYDAAYKHQLQVPPYADPLYSTPDPRAWWSEHRPLVLQTGALGPLEDSQISFNGFRVLSVKNDVIDKIHFISTGKLEASQYRLAWEEAIRPDPFSSLGELGQSPWTTVSEGSSTAGATITAVLTGQDRVALFLADRNGGIYTTSGSAQSGWQPWTSVSEGSSTPGATVTAVLTGQDRVALFLADRNGGIYTTSGSAQLGWQPWTSVSEGSSTPGATVTAVLTGQDRVALFLADRNGGIYTTSGSAQSGWQPWTSVSEGSSKPGATVTGVLTGQDRVALFLADPNGGIYTTSGSAQSGWQPWTSVSEGSSMPGGTVSAVLTGQDRVALFLADPNGGIYTTSGSAQTGWQPWTSVSEGSSKPGAPVTAVLTGQDRVALFLADPIGGIYTTSGSAQSGWQPWTSVSEGSSTPGGTISAVLTGQDRVALFLADPNGGIYTTTRSHVS